MNEQEIQEVLDELHKVRPEKLNDKGKRLFNAIMSIADERDLNKQRIDKAIEYLESYNTDFKKCRFGEAPISIRELGDLLDILKGKDNV